MFDQLVESSSHVKEDTRRGGLLLTTLVIVASIFVGGIIYSIFANDVLVGGDELELSTLVAPVPVPEEAPPPPEPEQPKEQKQVTQEKVDTQVPMRTDNIARTDEPIAPTKIETGPSNVKARPNTAFVLGDKNVDPVGAPAAVNRGDSTGGGGTPVAIAPKPQVVEDDDPPPPQKTPTPKPTPPPVPKTVSGGVVNGKAVNLVKPPYPPAARAVRASGTVNVQVTIDENGNVISANAVSGHALLRGAAESAARSSKFSPTLLSGQKVKVTGVIVYNFAAQ